MLTYRDVADINARVHEFVYGPVEWVKWGGPRMSSILEKCNQDDDGALPRDAKTNIAISYYTDDTDDALKAAAQIVKDGKAGCFKLMPEGDAWCALFWVGDSCYDYESEYASEAICGVILRMAKTGTGL